MKKCVLAVFLVIVCITVPMMASEMIPEPTPQEQIEDMTTSEIIPMAIVEEPCSDEIIPDVRDVATEIAPAVQEEPEEPDLEELFSEEPMTQPEMEDDSLSWAPDVVVEYAHEYDTIMIVDLAEQHAYCCAGGDIIADAYCVTGDLYDSPTPTGFYNVWYKCGDYYMMGSYYTAYAVFFNGEIAIHDADAWRDSYGGTIYQGSGSHGCINTPRWFAEVVYEYSEIGTPVYVY